VQLDLHARTDVGRVRSQNEDAFGLWMPEDSSEARTRCAVLAVADGMGGHPGGEVASALAVNAVCHLANEEKFDPPADFIGGVFENATEQIRDRGREEPRFREMGTTLTAAYLADGRAWVGHIGDTRLYWIRQGRVMQVTIDHNVAQELVDSGKLDPEAAEDHPMSNVLTRCLGVCPQDQPDLLSGVLELEVGDQLLLASDGLAKTVHVDAILELVANVDSETGTDRLVQAAVAAGAPDNVTVVLCRLLDLSPRKDDFPGTSFSFGAASKLDWALPNS